MITKEELETSRWQKIVSSQSIYQKKGDKFYIQHNIERHYTTLEMIHPTVSIILYTPTIEILNSVAMAFGVS